MKIKSIRQAKKIQGKRVFLRADFNVPIEKGRIKDSYRIVAGLPTIRFLLRYKCKIIIATHLGEPEKNKNFQLKIKNYTTKPVANKLSKLLGKKVDFISDCIGKKVNKEILKMKGGEILLLENLRFYPGEKKNDKKFAESLAGLADIYINDAFAVSHRNHASVSAVKKNLPSYAGLLLEKEVLNLAKILKPKKPFVAVMGGIKISTKLPVLKNILPKADKMLLGGAMANTVLKAAGFEIGKSIIDNRELSLAKKIFLNKSAKRKIILPIDAVIGSKESGGVVSVKKISEIGKNEFIFDIGPETIKKFSSEIKKSNTIIWNGPLGKFENNHFRHGTLAIARVIASRSGGAAFGLAGGGETIEALKMSKMDYCMDWVSTGGGAMLAFLAGEKMPGLKVIIN